MGRDPPPRRVTTRRRLLRTAAAGGALTALAGCSSDSDGTDDTPDSATPTATATTERDPVTVELDALTSGWVGRAPASIAGRTNPTLALVPGRPYEVVWANADGQAHDFAILDANGERLVGTGLTDEEGATRSVTFRATTEMDAYYCSVHPGSMRGAVWVGAESDGGDGGTTSQSLVPTGPTVRLEPVATGLTYPTDFTVADEGRERYFVTDQVGQVYSLGPDGLGVDEPFLDVSDRLLDIGMESFGGYDERGLLGIATHPDFAENGRFFLRYSVPRREDTPPKRTHVELLTEFRTTDDWRRGNPESDREVLAIPSPLQTHNSGRVAFGPDGYCYVGMGDGGGGKDIGRGHVEDWYDGNEGGNGQDVTENLLGSILRIDVDERTDVDARGGDRAYGIPDENPLVGREGLDEQYAWGFRNPWGMSFDGDDLYVADVGQVRWEEINRVEKGGNYGWNVREGPECFGVADPRDPPENCPTETPPTVRGGEPLRDPVAAYPHVHQREQVGSAIIGGHVYRGDAMAALSGAYVFGDWSSKPHGEPAGSLFVTRPPGEGMASSAFFEEHGLWPVQRLRVEGEGDVAADGTLRRYVLSMGRDADGELYVMTANTSAIEGETGAVYRLVEPTGT